MRMGGFIISYLTMRYQF